MFRSFQSMMILTALVLGFGLMLPARAEAQGTLLAQVGKWVPRIFKAEAKEVGEEAAEQAAKTASREAGEEAAEEGLEAGARGLRGTGDDLAEGARAASHVVDPALARSVGMSADELVTFSARYGDEAVEAVKAHPGVGRELVEAFDSPAAAAVIRQLPADVAIQMKRFAGDIAKLPPARREELLRLVANSPEKFLEALEKAQSPGNRGISLSDVMINAGFWVIPAVLPHAADATETAASKAVAPVAREVAESVPVPTATPVAREAVESVPVPTATPVAREAAQESLDGFARRYGDDGVEALRAHPTVGRVLVETFDDPAASALIKSLPAEAASKLAAHRDELAAMAPAERMALLREIARRPNAFLEALNNAPKVLKTVERTGLYAMLAVGGFYTVNNQADKVFGGELGPDGKRDPGLVVSIAKTLWDAGLGMAVYLAVVLAAFLMAFKIYLAHVRARLLAPRPASPADREVVPHAGVENAAPSVSNVCGTATVPSVPARVSRDGMGAELG